MKAAQQLMRKLRLVFAVGDQGRAFQRVIARDANPDRHRHSVGTQPRRHLGDAHRVIAVDMGEIFFSCPQHFHGPAAERLGDRHGLLQLAVHSAPAESTTLKAIVHEHFVG